MEQLTNAGVENAFIPTEAETEAAKKRGRKSKSEGKEHLVAGNQSYEEWELRRKESRVEKSGDLYLKVEHEKHKLLRTNVKITIAEAKSLNEPRLQASGNQFVTLYLLPGEEVEPIFHQTRK